MDGLNIDQQIRCNFEGNDWLRFIDRYEIRFDNYMWLLDYWIYDLHRIVSSVE